MYFKGMEGLNTADRHEKWRSALTWQMPARWDEAELMEMQPHYEGPVLEADEWGVLLVKEAPRCPKWKQRGPAWPYERCKNIAGYRTVHEGAGYCYRCKGDQGAPLRVGAILMGMAYADEMRTTPWEALLGQLQLLANQVQWLRLRVYEAERTGGAEALRPGGSGFDWVMMMEARGDRLAKTAKMCLDAGIAQQMVNKIEMDAEAMMKAALAGLDAAGIEGEKRETLLDAMSSKLLEIEGTPYERA
jgi:hypothetical protein